MNRWYHGGFQNTKILVVTFRKLEIQDLDKGLGSGQKALKYLDICRTHICFPECLNIPLENKGFLHNTTMSR